MSLQLHLIVTLPLSIFFLLLFARKANLICLLFIISQTCFNKNDFLLLINNSYIAIYKNMAMCEIGEIDIECSFWIEHVKNIGISEFENT